MKQPEQKRNTFVIQVIAQQNATWQGTVTWTERHVSRNFRSALELLRLIDSAVEPPPTLPEAEEASKPSRTASENVDLFSA